MNTTGDIANEIPIVLIGNKSDMGIKVDKAKVEKEWVQSKKARCYIETSALKHFGVEEAFYMIAKQSNDH